MSYYGDSQPQITFLDEYYLTNAEIDVLTTWGTEMAQNIQSGTMVVELGSGSVYTMPEHQAVELWKLIHIQQPAQSENTSGGIRGCW